MTSQPEQHEPTPEEEEAESRREFLRKSVYAVYATPLITALLVENASAAGSGGHGWETFCERHPWHPKCQ